MAYKKFYEMGCPTFHLISSPPLPKAPSDGFFVHKQSCLSQSAI